MDKTSLALEMMAALESKENKTKLVKVVKAVKSIPMLILPLQVKKAPREEMVMDKTSLEMMAAMEGK